MKKRNNELKLLLDEIKNESTQLVKRISVIDSSITPNKTDSPNKTITSSTSSNLFNVIVIMIEKGYRRFM